MALELETALYIQLLPMEDNVADDLLRKRYDLLHKIGAHIDSHRQWLDHTLSLVCTKQRVLPLCLTSGSTPHSRGIL